MVSRYAVTALPRPSIYSKCKDAKKVSLLCKNFEHHKGLDVPSVKSKTLEPHPNPLARDISNDGGHTNLSRRDSAALIRLEKR